MISRIHKPIVSKTTMIKTIIFDIGNVLADFAWKPFFASFKLTEEEISSLAKATIFSSDWVEYDIGNLTDEEILNRFCHNAPQFTEVLHQIDKSWKGIILKTSHAIPWITSLKKQGYQVLFLSNFSSKARRDCADALDFIPMTDGGIFSYKVHMVKPEPEIYQLLIDTYHLTPQECVFIDDTAINLTAAEKFGLHTIQFQTKEQVLKDLAALNVII